MIGCLILASAIWEGLGNGSIRYSLEESVYVDMIGGRAVNLLLFCKLSFWSWVVSFTEGHGCTKSSVLDLIKSVKIFHF